MHGSAHGVMNEFLQFSARCGPLPIGLSQVLLSLLVFLHLRSSSSLHKPNRTARCSASFRVRRRLVLGVWPLPPASRSAHTLPSDNFDDSGCGCSAQVVTQSPLSLHSCFARSAVASGMYRAAGWYLSTSGSLTVIPSSPPGIYAPGHRTLESSSASWHFHSPCSYRAPGTHPPHAQTLRSCSYMALHSESCSLIPEGDYLQSTSCFGPLPIGLSHASSCLPSSLHRKSSPSLQTPSLSCAAIRNCVLLSQFSRASGLAVHTDPNSWPDCVRFCGPVLSHSRVASIVFIALMILPASLMGGAKALRNGGHVVFACCSHSPWPSPSSQHLQSCSHSLCALSVFRTHLLPSNGQQTLDT